VREMGLYHAPPFQPDMPEPLPTAYGYGLMNAIDPKLGRVLHHPGGLPGYGSHLLMLPDRGWGVFAFANRTYAPMSKLTPRLARILHEALPKRRAVALSPALRSATDAVAGAYGSGRIEDVADLCAPNLLVDTPPQLRNVELADLKRRLGEGKVEAIEPTHELAGFFTLACERGRLKVTVILSPERRPRIQKLVFAVADKEEGGKSSSPQSE
jgi:D-alanyl-D-alanine-carboxypeptidase/D-alanyl-D-alanine-endopeptidase